MRLFLIALISLIALPLAALAQSADRPNTILVLDGSGSMWGQIEGINKIVIAREVIADLLADMPDETSLGLTVYGHRERGSCSDIETIVAPAPFTQDAILEAVNAINPRGRTPMTDAVIAAAQSLRHTENPATVILVSDGIENCNPDPCAIAAELEAAGVAFTAHVVGFDVASEPEARAQMQCIAENTGGLFLTADNASELGAALQQVVMAPAPVPTRFQAVIDPTGAAPTRPVTWTIMTADGVGVLDGATGPALDLPLAPGGYIARATRLEDTGPAAYQSAFTVLEATPGTVIVTMPEIVDPVPVSFTARVLPDMSVPASVLTWTLIGNTGATLLGPVDAPGGNVDLLPGAYRIEVLRVSQGTRHSADFTVAADTPQDIVIPLPALSVDVTFSARLDSADGALITDPVLWEVTPVEVTPDAANPLALSLSRGAYSVTAYWTAQEVEQSVDFVIVDQPRDIVVVFETPLPQASLVAPETAVAGSSIEVGWTGPDNPSDYIGIGAVDATGNARWETFAYTEDGNPATLQVPATPGEYLIRYFLRQDRVVIAEVPLTVTPAAASLTAPATATAGSTIEVGWTGPDYHNDYIGIGAVGATGNAQWETFAYTEDGNPAAVAVPTEPGEYLIRYYMRQDRVVIAEVPLTVTPVAASITAPETATAGSTIEVGWTGPDYHNDYIGIGAVGATGNARWENFAYTEAGNPATLLVPTTPGDYLIRYYLDQDRVAIAEVPISVTEVGASITAPATAIAGSSIEVGWTGPDNRNDYIGIGAVGATGNARWENFAYTEAGNPATLLVPTMPGDYLIRYYLDQDRVAIAEVPISVQPVTASITAPASAVAGSTVDIDWTGPDYRNDYIGIGAPGATGNARWENFTYTSDGTPLALLMPATPGPYLIRYYMDQDRVTIGETSIIVTPAMATLSVKETSVEAGSMIEVDWTGPDYRNDYIGMGPVGASRNGQWEAFAYTEGGTPAMLQAPDTPGDYVIQYFMDQDRTSIATLPITVR